MKTRIVICVIVLLAVAVTANSTPSGPWKPELTHRPRLLWSSQSEWTLIVSRLDREPYATIYQRVKSRAGATLQSKPALYNPAREYSNANIAKDAAFVYAVEGLPSYGDKAVAALLDIDTSFSYQGVDGLSELLTDDIHVADAIQGYCAAFDILAGAGYFDAAAEQEAAGVLQSMLEAAWQFYFGLYYSYLDLHIDNHYIKLAAAFGTAAITFNDHELASPWIHTAMANGIDRLYAIVDEDGAVAEGPSYHVFSANNYIPFFLQYDRFTGGADSIFEKRNCALPGLQCTYEPVFVGNPIDDPRLASIARWALAIRLPDGRCPPIDDSFTIGGFGALLAGPLDDPALAWDWLNAPGTPLYSGYLADVSVDILCSFNDGLPVQEPDFGPSVVFPHTAAAVLRTGWGADDAYVLFLAEKGVARSAVPGHEHADNLSFQYWQGDTALAVDSGYIQWSEHDEVRFGIDHNVMTVDGVGPPTGSTMLDGGVDADITAWTLSGTPEIVIGTTRFAGTDWHRGLFFFGDALAVIDVMRSDAVHEYEFLLHGAGDVESFYQTGQGAHFGVDPDGFSLVQFANKTIMARNYTDIHSFTYGQKIDHVVYGGAVTGDRAGFLSMLIPDTAENTTLSTVKNGVNVYYDGGEGYFLLSNEQEQPEQGELVVEQGAAWIEPSLAKAVLIGAGLLQGESVLLRQSKGVSVTVTWGDDYVEFLPDTIEGNLFQVDVDGPYAEVTGDCVAEWGIEDGTVSLELDEPCAVRVEPADLPSDDDDDAGPNDDDDFADDDDDQAADDDDFSDDDDTDQIDDDDNDLVDREQTGDAGNGSGDGCGC